VGKTLSDFSAFLDCILLSNSIAKCGLSYQSVNKGLPFLFRRDFVISHRAQPTTDDDDDERSVGLARSSTRAAWPPFTKSAASGVTRIVASL